jgi:kynurenine formamidase
MQVKAVYDLTHRITPEMFHPDGSPQFETYETHDVEGCSSSRMSTTLHLGTHLDAPWHFYSDGPSMGEVPADRLVGPGVVVDVSDKYGPDQGSNLAISAADLEAAVKATGHSLDPGDIIIVNTGWHHLYSSDPQRYYKEFSTLSGEAGKWLAGKEVRLVAVDCADLDEKRYFAEKPFKPPNHSQHLLPNGICVCENAGGDLDKILGRKLLIVAGSLPILGEHGNASPMRLLAVDLA